MTTLWARMLVFEECKKGKITEDCAHYFDSILNDAERALLEKNPDFKNILNGSNENCVLGQLGAVQYKNENYSSSRFDVLKYMRATTFKDGVIKNGYKETAYLANIIGQEFVGLDARIITLIIENSHMISKNSLKEIKRYLEGTYEETSKKDVSRLSDCILKTISKELQDLESGIRF